jgi:uncharacterized protein YegL
MSAIDQCYFEFHDSDTTILGEETQFGILRLKTSKAQITKKPTFILFTIDNTGSMNENGTRCSSKMDVVKQSFKNIVRYLSNLDAPVVISVQTFNSVVKIVIDQVKLTLDNADEMIEKIQSISADGCTNIEMALNEAKSVLDNYQEKNKDHQTAHIFMTDGHATEGSVDNDVLNSIVSNSQSGNVFIGFGSDHNIHLLKRLSENNRSFYQYIRDFESTACIYGEILHPYLYPCIENMTIMVENGQIYDWTNGTWTDRIEEDIVIGEIEKIYHIKKRVNFDIVVDVYGDDPNVPRVVELPHLISQESSDIIRKDLTQYMFRYMTLDILFRCTKGTRDSRSTLQTDIRDLFTKIRDYARVDQNNDNPFIKQLCDDLYIAYRGLNDRNRCPMLTLSRYTSQGRQQTNISTPRHGDLDEFQHYLDVPQTPRPRLVRQQTNAHIELLQPPETIFENHYEIDSYVISESTTSCYATQTVLDTMTEIQSQNTGTLKTY